MSQEKLKQAHVLARLISDSNFTNDEACRSYGSFKASKINGFHNLYISNSNGNGSIFSDMALLTTILHAISYIILLRFVQIEIFDTKKNLTNTRNICII